MQSSENADFIQGLDLAAGTLKTHFTFVDGLTKLFSAPDGRHMEDEGVPVLRDSSVKAIERTVVNALSSTSQSRQTLLIFDGLDLVLAATQTSAYELIDMVAELQEACYLRCSCYL